MAITYSPIATATGTGSSDTVTFSSIPSTYTDLVLIVSATAASGASDYVPFLTFNNDTTTNYSTTTLRGDGSAASSVRDSNETGITLTSNYGIETANLSNLVISIMNYSNATTYKTVLDRYNSPSRNVVAKVGLYRSTSAINRLDITLSGVNWSSTSTFTLYGIKAA